MSIFKNRENELREKAKAKFVTEEESYYKLYEALIQDELRRLAEPGFPAPYTQDSLTIEQRDWITLQRKWFWQKKDFAPTPGCLEMKITFPRYTIPPYGTWKVGKYISARLLGHDLTRDAYYCLSADSETVDDANRAYKQEGIAGLVAAYPNGVICNRDPYALFSTLNKKGGRKLVIQAIRKITYLDNKKGKPISLNPYVLADVAAKLGVEDADETFKSSYIWLGFWLEEKLSPLHMVELDTQLPRLPPGEKIGVTETPPVKPVRISEADRPRHVYIIGKSGTGKSTLIKQMARLDIERGAGVAVIDPHGDLAQQLLDHIPQQRVADTIYFDASDEAHPIALNIMNAQTEPEISRLTDDLLVTFHRLSESWGDKMEHILGYAFETLLRTPEASFIDLKTLLTDPAARGRIVSKLTKPDLLNFWQNEFAGLKNETQPVLTRLSKFTRSSFIYSILSQPQSPLDFYELIQNKKILLVNLASGIIGESAAGLLGSLIVSQLQLAVMRRARIPEGERTPYYLYVDEFQNFTNSAFEKILSEARKYNLCLTLAHQYISQLPETQRDAIFGNVGTMIMFSVADKDANALKYQIGSYNPINLINLEPFRALYRPQTGARNTVLMKTLPVLRPSTTFAKEIIEHTRQTYSTNAAPPVKKMPQERPKPAPAASPDAIPALAAPKEFPSVQDKILYYISQAEYLSTAQIIELCFAHYSTEGSKKPMPHAR
jgi:energy-coupling factor transporter ATP-binding protein EcfA2